MPLPARVSTLTKGASSDDGAAEEEDAEGELEGREGEAGVCDDEDESLGDDSWDAAFDGGGTSPEL